MFKLRAKEPFTLGEFDKIKNLKRVDENFNDYGRLQKGDTFETDERMAKYLLNETANPVNRAVVELIEIVPELKIEKKAETEKKSQKNTNKSTKSKK